MVERLVRQMVTSISAAADVSALRMISSSTGPSVPALVTAGCARSAMSSPPGPGPQVQKGAIRTVV